MSASSGSIEREIDKYQDESPGSSGSYESSSESSGSGNSSSQDKYYSFGVDASSSRKSKSPSPPQDEEEDENVIYNYTPEVASTLDTSKLTTLVGRY